MSDSGSATTRCAVCQSTDGLKACSSCYATWYCSREHQKEHWKLHKGQCASQRNGPVEVSDISNGMATLGVSPSNGGTVDSRVSRTDSGKLDNPNDHLADADTVGRTLPGDLPAHITHEWLLNVANNIVSCLNKFGIAVVNKLLGAELGDKILHEAKSLHDRHLMTDGQTIKSSSGKQLKYRMDKISWVSGMEEDCMSTGTLVALIDRVMKLAQEQLTQYHIQGRTKAMVACYPGSGSCYVRHVDNPAKDGRLLTCIYYINRDWSCKEHGGMLKIYPEGTTKVACIEPIMDRLLVFWSDKRNPHEVMPAYKTRFAVTLWYFDAKERREAMLREVSKQTNPNTSSYLR